MVIPRILSKEIESLLFTKQGLFNTLTDVGLLYRGKGKSRSIYTLHDDVAMGILVHSQKELGSKVLSSWHDHEEVAKIHNVLIEFYEGLTNQNHFDVKIEIAYHSVLLQKDFETKFDFKREDYIDSLLASMSLSNEEKIAIVDGRNNVSLSQLKDLIFILKEEYNMWLKLFTPALYQRLKYLASMGKLPVNNKTIEKNSTINWHEDTEFLLNLSKEKDLKDDEYIFNLLGSAYHHKKEYDKAIEAYEKAVSINPKKDEAYYNMGNAYDDKKEYDKAIEAYVKAVSINPKKDGAYNNMGNAYSHKKEYDKAIEAYVKAVSINPKNDEAYYNMGNAYSHKKEYDKAIEAYVKAVSINPKKDGAYYGMGIAYRHKKEYDKAIEAYEKAVSINPKKDDAYYGMGIAYRHKKEYDKAIEAYEKAVSINPKKDGAYYTLGFAYYDKKEYNKAIEAYEKAVSINPKNDDAYYTLGLTYDIKKEYNKAIEAYEKALAINPKKDGAYYTLGFAYYDKKEYNKAIEAYEKALAINPKHDDAYYGMGITYYWLGKFDETIKAYSKALMINPNNSLAYVNLFELQLTQNQPFDEMLETKYSELFQNEKESFIEYEMLKIFQNIANGKSVNVENWKQKYEGVSFDDWSFDELREWIKGIEDKKTQRRLREALEVFEKHKLLY